MDEAVGIVPNKARKRDSFVPDRTKDTHLSSLGGVFTPSDECLPGPLKGGNRILIVRVCSGVWVCSERWTINNVTCEIE